MIAMMVTMNEMRMKMMMVTKDVRGHAIIKKYNKVDVDDVMMMMMMVVMMGNDDDGGDDGYNDFHDNDNNNGY